MAFYEEYKPYNVVDELQSELAQARRVIRDILTCMRSGVGEAGLRYESVRWLKDHGEIE